MTIFVDCTYTRTQPGNAGVTRVVRRLAAELAGLAGEPVATVVAGDGRFRLVESASARPPPGDASNTQPTSSGALLRLLDFVAPPHARRAVHALPLALLLPIWRCYSWFAYDSLARKLPDADIQEGDLVVLGDASWNYDVWRCAREAASRRAKIVTLVYDLIPVRFPQYCAPLFSAVFADWLKKALSLSDGIMCISAATAGDVAAYGAEAGDCRVPLDHFRLGGDLCPSAPGAEVRAALQQLAERAEKLFLAVGSIEPRKNHAFLLDVFEQVWAQEPRATLVIAGRPAGDIAATLARLASHPLRDRALFVFHDCTDAELDFLYRHARALVFPSAAEGFGLPLVEARRRGCLVLASDIPAFRELADKWVKLCALDSPAPMARAALDAAAAGPGRPPAMRAHGWAASAREFLAKANALVGRRQASE